MTSALTVPLCTFAEFVWLWNERQNQTTPRLHLTIARWLEARWQAGDKQLLLMAFRNSGKSTLVGLFAAWLLACNPNLRVLVLAADLSLAKKMVRAVKRLIERHPLTAGLRPERPDQWAADQFTLNRTLELRDPSMLARGLDANMTGSRADVIICDDVEVPNTCDTATKREDLRTKLGELEYLLVPGGLVLYVGTPHTFYSIYADEARGDVGEERPFLQGFTRLTLPILDAGGKSAWPERFSTEAIARIQQRTGPNKFRSQMMLEPVALTEGRLNPDLLRPYGEEVTYREAGGRGVMALAGRPLVAAACWWDPAYGARADGRGDGSVVAVVFADGEGHFWLHRVVYLRVPAGAEEAAATAQCRQVAQLLQSLQLGAVYLEINGLGRFLPGLLRQELRRERVVAAVVEVSSRAPKDTRILSAFDAPLAAGCLHVHQSVFATPFLREMREWSPNGRFHDDGLDAVAGALSQLAPRFPFTPQPARGGD